MSDIIKALKRNLNVEELIVFNILVFVLIKLVLPVYTTQLAGVLEHVTVFNSRDIIAETNAVRQSSNLSPLKANYKLDLAAEEKLQDMVKNEYFAHTSPAGVTPWYWFGDAGYRYAFAGENLALGYPTARDTVQAWMKSSSHRANLLNSNYQEIGVAVGKASLNGIDGVLVVQTFGKPYPTLTAADLGQAKPASQPVQFARSAPAPDPVVSGASAGQTEHISTDVTVPPTNPVVNEIEGYPAIKAIGHNLARGYLGYLMALITLLFLIGVFHGFKRSHIVSMAVNTALVIMTIVLPTLHYLPRAVVF